MEQKVYTYDEAVQASREYFGGDEMAAKVWVSKYALKDSQGTIFERTPADMHRRLAKELARIERKYPNPIEEDKIFELLDEFRYLVPQGGPMTGIGNDFQIASLSNCFVVGNEGLGDSYGGILKIDEEQVQLMKRRGGVGHDLSGIRPKGSPVMNSALTSTGIVPFMERYSNSTREVAQDGRRGALMLSISIQHPDAEDFIDAKLDTTRVTGANVSVRIDDAFMQAALSGQPYEQQYPVGVANPRVRKAIDAQRLWRKIVYNAWKSAEPGILFWDTIIRESIPDCYADLGYRTVSTNPCGEIPLCPYDSCRLLAINLYSYVDKPFTAEAHFDEELFREHVGYAQRLMDDIIDLELEKIAAIRAKIESDPE
ncbi:MAG: ribonucleoside-diphosphate reductase, adenosylcobalamin-dependent, partial [Bacteroidia bacterium]|nr:ribonucleoside-diphosphate reductase, adenosylcobalamin-dependent [Bacteroidia bacterium]